MCKRYIKEICNLFDQMTEEDNSGYSSNLNTPIMIEYGKHLDALIEKARNDNSLGREEIVMLIQHLPYGPIMDDYGSDSIDIIYRSKHFPIKELWFAKNFSGNLLELKTLALDERIFNLNKDNGIHFSFTSKILTSYSRSQISEVLFLAKKLNLCDIDNILTILSIINIESEEFSFPEEFDKELVKCIIENGYGFKCNNDDWKGFLDESFDKLNLKELNSYLDSIKPISKFNFS